MSSLCVKVDAQAPARWVPQDVLVQIAGWLDPLSLRSFMLSCKQVSSFELLQDFFQHVKATSGVGQLLRSLRVTDLMNCFVSGQLLQRVRDLAGNRLRFIITGNTEVARAVLECAAGGNDGAFLEEIKAACTEEELARLDVTPAVVMAMDLGSTRGSVNHAAYRVLRTFPSYQDLPEAIRSQVNGILRPARIRQGVVIALVAMAARYWGFV